MQNVTVCNVKSLSLFAYINVGYLNLQICLHSQFSISKSSYKHKNPTVRNVIY